MKSKKKITAQEFDKKFDDGKESILEHFDLSQSFKMVNVDLPLWAVKALDREAGRIGITRQALIKTWLVAKLDSMESKESA